MPAQASGVFNSSVAYAHAHGTPRHRPNRSERPGWTCEGRLHPDRRRSASGDRVLIARHRSARGPLSPKVARRGRVAYFYWWTRYGQAPRASAAPGIARRRRCLRVAIDCQRAIRPGLPPLRFFNVAVGCVLMHRAFRMRSSECGVRSWSFVIRASAFGIR